MAISGANERTGRTVEVNGAEIHYEEAGSGEPIVLVHGGFSTLESWGAVVPPLAERYRVITPDSRGHGRSTNPAGELSYPALADDVAGFIDALGLGRPVVGGWSDGGQVAIELGIRHPGAARALVAGGALVDFGEAYRSNIRGFLGMDEDGNIDVAGVRAMMGDMLPPGENEDGEPVWLPFLRQTASMWLDYPSLTEERVARIEEPVLVVLGDRDQLIPVEEAVTMYRWLGTGELAICPHADHSLYESRAAWFARTVDEFAGRVSGGDPGGA